MKRFTLLLLGMALVTLANWPTVHGPTDGQSRTSAEFADKPARLWRTRVGSELPSGLVGGKQLVFCMADTNTLTALDRDGAIRWTRTFPNGPELRTFSAPPTYVPNLSLVLVASDLGWLAAVQAETGEPQWHAQIDGRVEGAPTISETLGAVYIMEKLQGVVHARSLLDGTSLWKSQATERCDGDLTLADDHVVFGNCTASLFALDAKSGQQTTVIPLGDGHEIAGSVAFADGQVFTGDRSGALSRVHLATKQVTWAFRPDESELFTSPAVSTDRVFVVDGGANLHALHRNDGTKIWTQPTDGLRTSSPVLSQKLVLLSVDGEIRAYRQTDGAEVWKLSVGDETSPLAVIAGRLYTGADDGRVWAFAGAPPTDRKSP